MKVVHSLHPRDACNPASKIRHTNVWRCGLQQQQSVLVHLKRFTGETTETTAKVATYMNVFFLILIISRLNSDLWQSCGNQCNNSQQRESRIQVNQEAAGFGAVQAVWADQQHHQAVDQSQDGGTKTLDDQDEAPARHRPLSVM